MRVALACLAFAGCGAETSCPEGHHRDPARAADIVERLGSTPEGAALAALLPGTRGLCFSSEALDVITAERALLLSEAVGIDEAAARTGHLLVHARDGLPMPATIPAGADCDALVAVALEREAEAHLVEWRLQRALGASPRRHAFEFDDELLGLTDGARRAAVRAYLAAHPAGAPGIDGLGAGYLSRCLRER
jgi:hypothetical protein